MLRDGMARFCTEKWDIKSATNYDNICMHLTNYAVNKENSNYIQGTGDTGEGGSKRSMQSVFKNMLDDGVDVNKL